MKTENLTGKIFGQLEVLEYAGKNKYNEHMWKCKCNCGNITIVRGTSLKRTKPTTSCGCAIKNVNSKIHRKHNNYDISGDYGIGYDLKGREFYFDLEDYDKIKDFCWCISKQGYCVCRGRNDTFNGKEIKMHRLLMNCLEDTKIIIDHINRDRKDNRKENLRFANSFQNATNAKVSRNNTSGVTGVIWMKDQNKWLATIRSKNQVNYLGVYADKDEAIKTRLIAEKEYHKEFAPQKHLFKKYGIE